MEEVTVSGLSSLPTEIFGLIIRASDFRTALRLSVTCRNARAASLDDDIWKNMYTSRWRWSGE